jgi:hypothetical protein
MQELRSALAAQLALTNGPSAEVTAVLKRLAREARENGVLPEELLVAFKEIWNTLTEPLRPKSPDQHERIRQNLVTLCIQAYYAE